MNIRKNFNLNKIDMDFSPQLNKGIDIIALDIQKGIEQGSQFGRAFKRNAPRTILKKGFDHPLKETGLMMDSGRMTKQKARRNEQRAILTPDNDRIDIAFWNDTGTPRIPARPFWGISEKAENEIFTRVIAHIDKEIKKC